VTKGSSLSWNSLTPAMFYNNSSQSYSYYRFVITQCSGILEIGGIILLKDNQPIISNVTIDSTGYILNSNSNGQVYATVTTSWQNIDYYQNVKSPAMVFVNPTGYYLGFNAPYEYPLTMNGNVMTNSPSTTYNFP
jgi:hypothetical protein